MLEGRLSKQVSSFFILMCRRAIANVGETNSDTKKQTLASVFDLNNKLQAQGWGIMP